MPRVKLAGDTYLDKDLVELIRRYKYGKKLTNAEAGKLIGVAERTFAKYMEHPEIMSLKTLRTIQRKLGIPKEEMYPFLM